MPHTRLTTGKVLHRVLPCLLLLLVACSTTAPSRQAMVDESRRALDAILADSAGAFEPQPELPSPRDLHALAPEQLADFLAYVEDPLRNHIPRHQRVYDYLKTITDQFDYYEQTLPASAALARRSGNCMSLAVLTSALAQAAGIEIGYRLMEDVPVFEYQGNTVVKGVHLSTILYEAGWTPPESGVLFVRRPGLQVDYFPSARATHVANVDEPAYLAMYYQNVAVENLERGNLDLAYWNALEALHYDPVHAPAINTLAIAHRRKGELLQAERLYRHGLAYTDDNLGLLRNYRALLVSQHRDDDARELTRLLEKRDDASPYRWLDLAYQAEKEADYDSAVRYYARALKLAPYMHEVQLGMALANYRAGHLLEAEHALEEAIALVPAPATRRLYETKLRLLNAEMAN